MGKPPSKKDAARIQSRQDTAPDSPTGRTRWGSRALSNADRNEHRRGRSGGGRKK